MDIERLRALQAPLKERYREQPESAVVTLRSSGRVDREQLACHVAGVRGEVMAGLHPAAGGDGSGACAGDMLLDALVACAGVTLATVATAMRIPLRDAHITAEGQMDFRGTLGVDRSIPVGVTDIRMHVALDTDAPADQIEKLLQLVERYCVVAQTLVNPPRQGVTWERTPAAG